MNEVNICGLPIGRLIPIYSYTKFNKEKTVYWHCECRCGKTIERTQRSLLDGGTFSCGCIKNEAILNKSYEIDLTGLPFGRITPLKQFYKNQQAYWTCSCLCGKILDISAVHIMRGITSCGCWRNEKFSKILSTFVGENSPRWKGGKSKDKDGYIRVYCPDHPRSMNKPYRLEHVLVMEEKIGRYLKEKENVHHINGIRDDNRIENLELWDSSQPSGQRHEDKFKFYKNWILNYCSETEKEEIFNELTKHSVITN